MWRVVYIKYIKFKLKKQTNERTNKQTKIQTNKHKTKNKQKKKKKKNLTEVVLWLFVYGTMGGEVVTGKGGCLYRSQS